MTQQYVEMFAGEVVLLKIIKFIKRINGGKKIRRKKGRKKWVKKWGKKRFLRSCMILLGRPKC